MVLLHWQHIGNLTLHIKVLLAAHFQGTAERVLGAGQRGCSVATLHVNRWQYIALCCQCVFYSQDRGQRFDIELDLARRAAGLHHRICHHDANHLADVLHGVNCKHGLVTGKGRQHRVAGNIAVQNDVAYTGHCACLRSIYAHKAAVGHVGQYGRGLQRAA